MVMISGTAFSAMGVPKLLYNVIFIWCQNISWQLYFFRIFQNFAQKKFTVTFFGLKLQTQYNASIGVGKPDKVLDNESERNIN